MKSILFRHAFIYIHFPVLCDPPTISREKKSGETVAINFIPNRFLSRFSTSLTNAPRSLSQAKVSTRSDFRERSHTRAYTAKQVAFWVGVVSLPSERFTRFGNPAWPGFKTANFAAFGAWSWVLPKNAESLRDSDALMRVAVPRRRGPAGLRDLFRFCRNCGLYALRSGPFRVCEARGGITTLSALYVLLKRRTAACQNGSFAVFLRSGGRSSPHDSYFLANTQNFLLAVPVANTFALWYDKFSKFEID